ncbi:MAG: hypothetical protein KAJ07_05805 [Planctomycetes bacterium]|nr:hypothetical protein [Planctomycetota bacterium]
MNAKKGCFRIAAVLSLLTATGGFVRLITASVDAQAQTGFLTMVGGPVVVIAVYLILWWIVKGFNENG